MEMELNEASSKAEESRSMPFDIDLNEPPICSPREVAAPVGDEVAPQAAVGSTTGESGRDKGKGKVVFLDINELPSEMEGDENGELVNSYGVAAMHDTSSKGNSSNGQVTSSNLLFAANQFNLMKVSGRMTNIVNSHSVDIVQCRRNFDINLKGADQPSVFMGGHWTSYQSALTLPYQNLGDRFLRALREYIFDNNGILDDGWHVEFFYCQSRCKNFALYCSPDGKKFETMFDVACHLGLVSNPHAFMLQDQRDGFALEQNRLHRRRKESLMFSRKKDFREFQENLKSSFAGKFLSGIDTMGAEAYNLRSSLRVSQANSDENGYRGSLHSKFQDGFPVQFGDFFVLALGEVDARPSYHKTCQIWPIGYKSSWHDRITGSLFVCDISDGGDCGPIFKVQRYPCSKQLIPVGSTILSRCSLGSEKNRMDTTSDLDDKEDINVQMIFSDNSPPHLDLNVLSDAEAGSGEVSDCQQMNDLQTDTDCMLEKLEKCANDSRSLGDDIGEFMVEGRSSSSVWKMVSQSLINACHEAYKKIGVCKFSCRHDVYEWWSSCQVHGSVETIGSGDSLAKFCHMCGPSRLHRHIQRNHELTASCEAMAKWLDQDRFGLDLEFVQEMIERLPHVHACSNYTFLNDRIDKSKLQTVGSGFLIAKRMSDRQDETQTDAMFIGRKQSGKQVVQNRPSKDLCPPGKPLSSKLPTVLTGDVLQSWELLWRFSEVLGLEEPISYKELEEELIDCCSYTLKRSVSTVNERSNHASVRGETEPLEEGTKARQAPDIHCTCTGETLTKAHCSLLKVVLAELQSKLAAFVEPALEHGELRSRKRRKKEADNLILANKIILDLLPINELTWPELARRYILTFSSMEGNLDSVEILSRESCKVFRCLQGDSNALCNSVPGVAGMEADALLLAEATKQIFGLSKNLCDGLNKNLYEYDSASACKMVKANDGEIPDWAQVLEPVRKLPTNVGARIRKCIYEALERNPPDWARRILEHSISKQVYKGNASGPTKKAVLSILANICGETQQQKPNRKRKNKCAITPSEAIMKQCRKVFRLAAAADEEKVFCNLLGRTLFNTSDNDDEGLLGFPTMVSRPLDFRTIDLRLAFGAYSGSHEAFLEDVRELWHHIRTAYADQSDLVQLAETLSQNFEELYENEVLSLVHRLADYAAIDKENSSSEAKKEMEDFLEDLSEVPKAPWDEGVCKVCGVDKDDDNVLLCDKCDSGYHTYCLSPPLARIPEGNWYCPSCVTGHVIIQGVPQIHQFSSQWQKKRRQGELMHGFLESLAHLGRTMEVKDYWEYSMEERVCLIKFLGDEVLNSANIREHLDQCFSKSADLQHKLRSLSAEWRTWKLKEENLSEKVAKVNASVLNGIGRSGTGEMSIVHPRQDKVTGGLNGGSLCSPPSGDLVHLDDGSKRHTTNDFPRWLYSKWTSEHQSSISGSQFMNTPDSEKDMDKGLVFGNSICQMLHSAKGEFSRQNKSLSLHQQQTYGSGGDNAAWTRLQTGIHIADHVETTHMNSEDSISCNQGCVHPDVDELHNCNLELSSIRNKIFSLQDSMASVESQLWKVYLRKDLLGRDSTGRLYWAFPSTGSSPLVVIDGTQMVLQNSIDKDSFLISSNSIFKASSSCVNGQTDGIPISSSWYSYQSDAELEELIGWLRENDPTKRDLLESLMQRLKVESKGSNEAGNSVHDICQPTSQPTNIEKPLNNALVTKASIALEKQYGTCMELDVTDILMSQDQNAEVTSKERMWRCECLEAIWPSKHHCRMCHWSFSISSELKEHKNGKCSSSSSTSENNKVNAPKGKAMMRTERREYSDKKRVGNAGNADHEVGFGSVGLPNELASPYDIEEISAKFVIRSSNLELVKEIGCLGSDGVPPFVPSGSPLLDDPSLKLSPSWENGTCHSDKSASKENLLQGLVRRNMTTIDRHVNNSNNSTQFCIANDVCKDPKRTEGSNLMNEKIYQSSLSFSCSRPINLSDSEVRNASLRPLVGRGAQILKWLKINLLDMDAAIPEEALKPSKACLEKRCTWRAFVKSAKSVFEMVQATIVFEDMVKTEYLRNEWWYCSSLSAAAKIATVSSLALRIYTLDAAIVYEKSSSFSPHLGTVEGSGKSESLSRVDPLTTPKPRSKSIQRTPCSNAIENGKPQSSRSGKKRKESVG